MFEIQLGCGILVTSLDQQVQSLFQVTLTKLERLFTFSVDIHLYKLNELIRKPKTKSQYTINCSNYKLLSTML